jgi:hypothetical protein
MHGDIQPSGWWDEQAQANGVSEEHSPRRPGFTGTGVVSLIVSAVTQAGFAWDQETGLAPEHRKNAQSSAGDNLREGHR